MKGISERSLTKKNERRDCYLTGLGTVINPSTSFEKFMKLKYIVLALCAGQLGLAQAQETAVKEAPAKEAKKEEATPAFEAKTPLEKSALTVMKVIADFPTVLGEIKDEASADMAKGKLDDIIKKLSAEAELIKKQPVPDNATRKALSEKLKPYQQKMEKEMQASMMNLMSMPPELGPKIQEIMMNFGPQMQSIGATMEKYFEPDPVAAKPPVPEEKK